MIEERLDIDLNEEIAAVPQEYQQEYGTILTNFFFENHIEVLEGCHQLLSHYDDQDTGMVRWMIAETLLELGEPDAAEKNLNEIQSIPYVNSRVHLTRAKIYVEEDCYELAEQELKQVEVVPQIAVDYYNTLADIRSVIPGEDAWHAAYIEGLEAVTTLIKQEVVPYRLPIMKLFLSCFEQDIFMEREDLLAEDIDRVTTYLNTFEPEKIEDYMLAYKIPEFSEIINPTPWARPYFKKLADALSDSGRMQEYAGSLNSCYSSIESYMANEDPEISHVLLTFMDLTTAASEEENDTERDYLPLCWGVLQEYQKNPHLFDLIQERYPAFWEEYQGDVLRLVEDPKRSEQEILDYLVNQCGIANQTVAKRYLERRCDALTFTSSPYLWLQEFVKGYPEEIQSDLGLLLRRFYDSEMDEAQALASDLLDEYDDRIDGIVRYVYTISLCTSRRGNRASRFAKSLSRDFPNSVYALLAQAASLITNGKLAMAERLLKAHGPVAQEAQVYAMIYSQILHEQGHETMIRKMLEEERKFLESFSDLREWDRSYVYALRAMELREDIYNSDRRRFHEDLEELMKLLKSHELSSTEEYQFVDEMEHVVNAAIESEWALDDIRALIAFMDHNRILAEDYRLIDMSYEALEAVDAMNDPKANKIIGGLISSLIRRELSEELKGQQIVEFLALSWGAAELLRNDRSEGEYYLTHYPHFIRQFKDILENIMESPDDTQEEAISAFMAIAPVSREELIERLQDAFDTQTIPLFYKGFMQ